MARRFTQTDQVDGAFKMIEQEHSLIHRGRLFTFSQVNAALGNNAHIYSELRVPADYEIHLKDVTIWMVDAPWVIKLTEAPTLTPGSAQVTVVNRKRSSSETPHMTVFSDPSGISGGTDLFDVLSGGGSGVGQTQSSGSAIQRLEWELKPSTTYLFDIQNTSGGAAAVSMLASFYEES